MRLVWLFAQDFSLELEGYLLMRPPIKRAPQGTHRGYYHSTPLTEASRLLHLTNSSKINGFAASIPRLLLYKACFVAKIYLLCRAPTILLSLPLWDRIYGKLWKPGGRVFAWQRRRGGNSYRQIGSSAVKRTKQMGFRLGEIFSLKCVLNLAQVLTYAVSVLPASPRPRNKLNIERG